MRGTILTLVFGLVLGGATFAQQSPNQMKGPVVEGTTDTTAVIAWSTNRQASTVLKYGTDPNRLDQTKEMPWGGLTHRIHLTGLRPGTTYYYQVQSGQFQGTGGNESSPVEQFQTKGAASASGNLPKPSDEIKGSAVVEGTTDNGATIAWTTERQAYGRVRYGTDPNHLDQTKDMPWGGTNHRAQLTGLKPDTTYYFIVESGQFQGTGGKDQSSVQQFKTKGSASASGGAPNPSDEIKGPVVEGTGSTTATIAWSTARQAYGRVRYGTNPNHLDQTKDMPWGGTNHRAQLTGLKPDTTYYFMVESGQFQGTGGKDQSSVQQFKTKGSSMASEQR